MCPPDFEQYAIQAFEAYNGAGPNPWKTWDGKEVPQWSELGGPVREKWIAAVRSLLDYIPRSEWP